MSRQRDAELDRLRSARESAHQRQQAAWQAQQVAWESTAPRLVRS